MMLSFGLIGKEDLMVDFGSGEQETPEGDSDLESECQRKNWIDDESIERMKMGVEHLEDETGEYKENYLKKIKQISD